MQRSKRVQVKQLNHRSLVNLLLSPAFLAAAQAESLAAWCHAQALAAFLLPRKCIVTTLYILNNGTGDLLAYLTAQPTNKMQLERQRQVLAAAQQRINSQQSMVEDLQREVDMLRADRRKLQRHNAELLARLEQSEGELAKARLAATTSNPGDPNAADDASNGTAPGRGVWPGGGRGAEAGEGEGPRWGLHAAVAAAAVAVRWWLAVEGDPVQRKIMLVVLWPAAWIYAAMLLGCVPTHSPSLRRFFLCLAYIICGYVARCAAERILGQSASNGVGGQGVGAPRWPPHMDWMAFANHHGNNHGDYPRADSASMMT